MSFAVLWSRYVKPLLYLALGGLLGGLVINVFYTPIRLTMGGVSGIASIVFQLTGQGNFLPLGTMVALLNIPLLILGWVKIGFRFVWRSIVGTFIYSAAVDLTASFSANWFEQYINLPLSNGNLPDLLIFCLFGGIIYGISMGLILKGGYTTGGTDILGVVMHRRWPNLSIGKILMGLDFVVICSTVYFYRHADKSALILAMYSFVALYLTSRFTDLTLEGYNASRVAHIISSEPEQIAEAIFKQLDRGATLIPGQGMYSKNERPVVFTVVDSRQVPKLKKLVKAIDPKAFVTVAEANEVMGEGWERDSSNDFLNE